MTQIPLMDAQADAPEEDLGDLLLEVLPGDGGTMGNQAAREALSQAAGREISEEAYGEVRERLVERRLIRSMRSEGRTPRRRTPCLKAHH